MLHLSHSLDLSSFRPWDHPGHHVDSVHCTAFPCSLPLYTARSRLRRVSPPSRLGIHHTESNALAEYCAEWKSARYPAPGSLLVLVVDDFFFGTQRRSAQVFWVKKEKPMAEARGPEPDAFYRLIQLQRFLPSLVKLRLIAANAGRLNAFFISFSILCRPMWLYRWASVPWAYMARGKHIIE